MGIIVRFIKLLCRLVSRERGSQGKSISGSQDAEEAHSDRWSHQLPQDIIYLVLQRLRIRDHIRLGAVCTSLREAVAAAKASPILEFPLVFYSAASPSKDDHLFLSLVEDKSYNINPIYTRGRKIVGVFEGRWLIMLSNDAETITPFFLNPITGEQVMLPLQSTVSNTCSRDPSFFKTIIASSEPTNSDCLVAGLTKPNSSGFCLVFCRITDTKWTVLDQDDKIKNLRFLQSIIFCDGKLYASTSDVAHLLVVFDLRHDNVVYKAQKIVIGAPRPIAHAGAVRKEGLLYHYRRSFFALAADSVSKELLLICYDAELSSKKYPKFNGSTHYPGVERFQAVGFKVYKMDSDHSLWIEVADIGDRLLFIGNLESFFISVKSLGVPTLGNCIYYSFAPPGFNVGRFCLTDRTIVHDRPKQLLLQPCNAGGWFVPTL